MGLKWTEKGIILFYSLTPFLYLARTLFGDSSFTSVLLRSFEPLIILLFTLSALKYVNKKAPMEWWVLVFIGLYGTVVGLFQGNQPLNVVSTLSHYLCGLIIFFYYYQKSLSVDLDRFLTIFSIAVLLSVSCVVVLVYLSSSLFGISIYLGLATQSLIIVFAYNVHSRRFFLAAFALVLIIASGKRGVLVALLLGTLLVAYPIIRRYWYVLSKFIVAGALLIPIILLTNIEFSERLISKFNFNPEMSLNYYSAGRITELRSAVQGWTSSAVDVVYGSGFGFSYTYVHNEGGFQDVEYYRNVHFSYANPLISLGFVSIVYFLCLFSIFFKAFSSRAPLFFKWSLVSYLVYTCFVFNLFNEPILWLLLGSMAAIGSKVEASTDFGSK